MPDFASKAERQIQSSPVNSSTTSEYVNVRKCDPAPGSQQRQPKETTSRLFQCAISFLAALACWNIYTNGCRLNLSAWRADPTLPSSIQQGPSYSASESLPLLEVFQVYKPIADIKTQKQAYDDHTTINGRCQVLLMEYSFGFSYGKPFVGNYHPPKCKFNAVTMNLTVTSKGRQFDRLAIMYLNDTEVYRTSTAEPTRDGIRWEYHKDMTAYLSLWASPQKIIFDLGNLVNDVYTGAFNATLIASFSIKADAIEPASLIVPISARKSSADAASLFMLPEDKASNTVRLPRNIKRAVFSISACGQAQEEFFWANTLQSDRETFSNSTGTLYGHSPFREVQVLIDGALAGVQWPFPVIFTGGVVPGLWRPIVGIDSFDLKEHEIDISPWLSVLCDGKEHTFEIKVFGIDNHGDTVTLTAEIGSSWYVTGKIFIWQDDDDSHAVATGRPPMILLSEPAIELNSVTTQDVEGTNITLAYVANIQRTLSISSVISTPRGVHEYSWSQTLSLNTYNRFTRYGEIQYTIHTTRGTDQSTGPQPYSSLYDYNLHVNSSYSSDASGNFTLDATLMQKHNNLVDGASIFDAPSGTTTQVKGSAHFFASPKAKLSTGYGSTSQTYYYIALQKKNRYKACMEAKRNDMYFRDVAAVNGTVVKDVEELCHEQVVTSMPVGRQASVASFEYDSNDSPRKYLGRGP